MRKATLTAVYARTATDEQIGSEMREQADRVLRAIPPDDREGVVVYMECASGNCGFQPEPGRQVRPELARLTSDIAAGKIRSVYVQDELRLARDQRVREEFTDHCRAHGVSIYLIEYGTFRRYLDAYPICPAILEALDAGLQEQG